MNLRDQQLCIWCGLVFGNLFFISIILLKFFPPPDATLTGEAFIASIEGSIVAARLGIVIGLFATMLSIPWNAIIAVHVARAEGKVPLWATVSFGGGTLNTVAFLVTFLLFAPAVFRLGRDPELVRLMVDTAWLVAVIAFAGAVMQCIAMAIGGFRDRRAQPIFPRWVCYFLLWAALLFTPGGLALFFKTGPFSWNGILAFWVVAVVFGIYLVVMTVTLLKAAKRHVAELEGEL